MWKNSSVSQKVQRKESDQKQGKDVKKLKHVKKKRLIVRNLSFKLSEEDLKSIFSEYGEVLEVCIPVMKDGRKRGFGFIQYADMKSVIKAMKGLNFKKIHGRPIAIDYAISKTAYQEKFQKGQSESDQLNKCSSTKNVVVSDASESSEDEGIQSHEEMTPASSADEQSNNKEMYDKDKRVKTFFKEFDADKGDDLDEGNSDVENSSCMEDSDDESDLNSTLEKKDNHDTNNTNTEYHNAKRSQDVSEGKTVFLRNVSFNTSQEDLHDVMQKYGELEYCLICMDKLTDHPKGTAFAKFKEKEKANKFIEEASNEPGIFVDGRRLLCTYAVSREELNKKENDIKKPKDKRNLMLLKCGLILAGSTEAEGVSQADMAKRAQLEVVKKQKLKNVNFFVSDKRLAIHNLPKNFTDQELRKLFKKAAGKETVITEARVMRDFKKTDAQGVPVSRGFGFVLFTKHEDALKALLELNNNPRVFTLQKRPIVEFSIENKVALLSKERRREKMKMRNKKRMEEKEESKSNENFSDAQKIAVRDAKSNKNKRKQSKNKKIPKDKNSPHEAMQRKTEKVKKQKKSKSQQKKKRKMGVSEEDKKSMSLSINKYKEKLLNKIS